MCAVFPKFASSDNELNITYNYRCELYGRHIKKTPSGYVITEFLPDVPWAGIYNTISCAASHRFREGRWMHDTSPLEDYAKFWCTEGNPRLYSFPLVDSVLSLAKVTGNMSFALEFYPRLKEIHSQWDDHKTEGGMYRQLCDRDGMEYSVSGDGIRPTINSYMYADKKGLAFLAEYLQTEKSPVVTAKDYMSLLFTYAYSHGDKDGSPWLDENMDGITGWKRVPENPLVMLTEGGWDESSCYKPTVIKGDDGTYRLWYNGRSEGFEYIGYAAGNLL